jgi:predicted regulator of Ras-like GTPase activity (Roadblock/LC7/MglB family)
MACTGRADRKERRMKVEAEKAFKEMLDISTDIDKALLAQGERVLASNFPEELDRQMLVWAGELSSLGEQRARDMGSQPLTQLVVEAPGGAVFLVREAAEDGLYVLATGKKASRIGLVLYDMKTCIRDARELASTTAATASAEEG